MRSIKDKRGFTLVELIVVLVILAILAAVLIPSLIGYIDKAKQRAVIAEARDQHDDQLDERKSPFILCRPHISTFFPLCYFLMIPRVRRQVKHDPPPSGGKGRPVDRPRPGFSVQLQR